MFEWITTLLDSAVAHVRMVAIIELACAMVVSAVLIVLGLWGWDRAEPMDDIDKPMARSLSIVAIVLSVIVVCVALSCALPAIIDPAGAVAAGLLR